MNKIEHAVLPGERQLFLDDKGIMSNIGGGGCRIVNLKKTMHPPVKKGAVIRPDAGKGEKCLQTRSAPMWEPESGVYRFWVSGHIFESADGLHWAKTRDRKTITGPRPSLVVRDPGEGSNQQRYKGLARAHLENTTPLSETTWYKSNPAAWMNFALEPVASPDGEAWTRINGTVIPSQDECNLSYDDREQKFIASVKHIGPAGRAVYISTSPDFLNWTEPALAFFADDYDQVRGVENIQNRINNKALKPIYYDMPEKYNVDVYNMGIFRYEGLYIGMPALYHKTGQVAGDWHGFDKWGLTPEERNVYSKYGDWGGFHQVQLACSRDLFNWERLGGRKPFLDHSPAGAGAYDLTTIIGPSCPVRRGQELWFYYTGIKEYGGKDPYADAGQDAGGICLAVLRRDGFVSIDAADEEGFLITEPFAVPQGELHLNLNAKNGYAVLSLCDEAGEEIPGLARSEKVAGDHLDKLVQWPDEAVRKLAGRMASIRITLRNAQLFSYWFES